MLGTHPLGIYEKAWNPEDSWGRRLEQSAELGFDFMEICIDESDQRLQRLKWSGRQIQELANSFREWGISPRSMCLSGHRRFPFGSRDPEIRRNASEILKKAVAFAGEMGIRVIQLAGYDVYYEPATRESRLYFEEAMQWAAKEAAASQIMLALEIMDTTFLNSITKYMEYEEKVGSPWFGVYPDLGNLSAWGNDVPKELEKGIHKIVGIHLKDTLPVLPEFPGRFKNVPFSEGCVDFSGCFSALERMGYRGPYLIEMWHRPEEDSREQVSAAKTYLEQQFLKAMEGQDNKTP